LRVRHRDDPAIHDLYPCAYGGGGSCAFDRRKFLELGGFDELLAPFYMEDTDLGYLAWKRGWKVLYQPRSIVFHEHRGTIGKRFSRTYIDSIVQKNLLLFCWKNIHEWSRLAPHFIFTVCGAFVSAAFGDAPQRPNLYAFLRAARQIIGAMRSRMHSRALAVVSDTEAFRRPLGGYFRDRFEALGPPSGKLNVLFVSPYAICPPVHGGGVFMYQTTRELARLCDLHLFIMLDYEREAAAHRELEDAAASVHCVVRKEPKPKEYGSIVPYAVRDFAGREIEWLLHRNI
jgi:hypothetical protein